MIIGITTYKLCLYILLGGLTGCLLALIYMYIKNEIEISKSKRILKKSMNQINKRNVLLAKKLINNGKTTERDFKKAGVPMAVYNLPCMWGDYARGRCDFQKK